MRCGSDRNKLIGFVGIVIALNIIVHFTSAQSPSPLTGDNAVSMRECDSGKCMIWRFNRDDGTAVGENGEIAFLKLKSVRSKDSSKPVFEIVRHDFSGSGPGQEIDYEVNQDRDGMHGKWHTPDGQRSGDWYALIASAPDGVPSLMHWCGPANCYTLRWSDGHYIALQNGVPDGSAWTVESFRPEFILLSRSDGNDPAAAELTGRISQARNEIESNPGELYVM